MTLSIRTLGTALAIAAVGAVAGCGSATTDGAAGAADGKVSVVATTPEVADFARNVGGDAVKVTQIIKPNVDPHDYEPTPADIKAIGAAKLVVKNGVGLEKWLDDTISSAGFKGTVVDTSQGVALRKGDPGDEEMKNGDPHIWHDPRNAKMMAENIEKAFVAADPGHADAYRSNFQSYAAKLDNLDADNERKFAALPADQRKLVTNHDAFGYYIDRYRLQFIGAVIPSLDTSAELSATQIDDLVAKIKATGTKAIFSESSLPPKAAEAIARQAGVKVVGGEDALYGDSLGPEGTPQGTYLGAEEHNTDTIVAALGG
ncbi:metal ABC transporter substrate-binding protein [Micromonospora sp. NBC_00898]|uniref:metal ABC transporter substrate-binding protein n=1 Tax=Micromonospora sp. NBC_00898 TaxID=2975981 RepID=UPI0038650F3C|nr:metal ABC transporter substrate-binding protein [Micromonospora sp. NBC_00898]